MKTLLERIKRFIGTPNVNENLTKTSAFKKKLELGDFVLHTPTMARGILSAIERSNGLTLHTVSTRGGRVLLRGAARQELRYIPSEQYTWER